MPIRTTSLATADDVYASPFVGPINHSVSIDCNIANLTAFEVDADGVLKPGVPLMATGALVGAAGVAYGVTIEATKLVANNGAARTGTFQVAVATLGLVNRDVVEDILGRVLTANEIAGFGGGLKLTNT